MSTPAWLTTEMSIPCTAYGRVEVGRDEYNNVLYGDLPPVDTFCFIQPVSQDEIQDGRAEVGNFLVHLPASVVGVVDGFSRIEIGGLSYEVIGPPAVYGSLARDGVHHVEVIVARSSA